MYSIRLEGDTQALLHRLRSLSEINRRDINATLGQIIRESTLERFQQGLRPYGRRWRTSIRAAQEGGKTLVQTAQLRNSIRVHSDDKGFAVGTNVKHAATHQFGEPGRTIRARRAAALRFRVNGHWVTKKQVRMTIPARPFLGLSIMIPGIWITPRAIGEKLFTNSGKKRYNESEVKKDVKH